jgi:hypothetical protein
MATLEALSGRVRMELSDPAKSFVYTTTATGTNRYEIPYSPVDGASLQAFVDAVDVSDDCEVEQHTGVVTFDVAPTLGDDITIQGTYYRYFLDSEISEFVNTAVKQHAHNRVDEFGRAITLENLPVIEEYPLTILATIQGLYTLLTDASFDIDISTPDGVGIPRSQRHRQLMELIEQRRAQYNQLCEALNIGLNRIEVFTFRRISRMTNRYVPVYLPQEVDDRSKPQRAYLPLPTYGAAPAEESVGRYDMVFTQGDDYSVVLDFPFVLTGYTPLAQIRLYPESAAYAAEFVTEVVDAELGQLRLSLPSSVTKRIPLRAYWDVQLTNNETEEVKTYIAGSVFCKRQVSRDQSPQGNYSPTGWEQPSVDWGGAV